MKNYAETEWKDIEALAENTGNSWIWEKQSGNV